MKGVISALRSACFTTTPRKLMPFSTAVRMIGLAHHLDHRGADHGDEVARIVKHDDGDRQHELGPDRPAAYRP